MDPGTPLLLETADAALELGLSPSRVKELADEGALSVEARTRRGVRLFRADEVERLRRERHGRRKA